MPVGGTDVPTLAEGTWGLREALRWGAKRLADAGVARGEGAAREAAILLSHCLGIPTCRMYARLDLVEPEASARYAQAIARRCSREPIQYITGVQEFMSLAFAVDQRVLIPRPDTETLVEVVLEHLARRAPVRGSFADVGTGSGAVAVSIAKYGDCGGFALDSSRGAIEVATENARRHGVADRLVFLVGDLLSPLEGLGLGGTLECVVSNPPYVTPDEYESLDPQVRDYEPREALVCPDTEGLYGRLADQAAGLLRPGGLLAVEVGYGAAELVADVFSADGHYCDVGTRKDLGGVDRVVYCERKREGGG
ncbi:MAG: peptide chain release factor N(5)-glutamine methyltransferase [Firmicutes bacterium]|nr:peptide chain release factor N(5)-glutamine methyltransferase [Bacillota bacterium]